MSLQWGTFRNIFFSFQWNFSTFSLPLLTSACCLTHVQWDLKKKTIFISSLVTSYSYMEISSRLGWCPLNWACFCSFFIECQVNANSWYWALGVMKLVDLTSVIPLLT